MEYLSSRASSFKRVYIPKRIEKEAQVWRTLNLIPNEVILLSLSVM